MTKKLQHMKEMIKVLLTLLAECNDGNIDDKIVVLCGLDWTSFLRNGIYTAVSCIRTYCLKYWEKRYQYSTFENHTKEEMYEYIVGFIPTFCRVSDINILDKYTKFIQTMHGCSLRNVKTIFPKVCKSAK